MTTIAMAAGMMPSAPARSVPAANSARRWRWPVIGGLVFSTVLSLVFVPAMFMMMDDIGGLFWRYGKKLLASSGENEHDPAGHGSDHSAEHKGPPPPPTIVHSPAAE